MLLESQSYKTLVHSSPSRFIFPELSISEISSFVTYLSFRRLMLSGFPFILQTINCLGFGTFRQHALPLQVREVTANEIVRLNRFFLTNA